MDERTLNDLLECSVCLERLDTTSKVLPCQHTFCRKCLEVIVASHTELRCPECRILVEIKIEELPPNVLLMRILEGMKNASHNQINATKNATTANLNKTGITNQMINQKKLINPSNQSINEHIYTHQNAAVTSTKSLHSSTNLPHAKALYDFISKEPGDLSFKKGDSVVLRKRINANWFIGELNGREGAFPVNYVQILVPLPLPQCKALYDFRMGPNEEEGCLIFKKGAIINVFRRVDHNWAEGRIGDCIGIFPIAFVEMNALAKQIMDSSAKYVPYAPSSTRSVPPPPQVQLINETNSSSNDSSSSVTSPNSSTSSNTTSSNSSTPSSPTNNLLVQQQQLQQQQQAARSRDQRDKRHSLTAITPNTSNILQQNNRHSAEILSIPDTENSSNAQPTSSQTENVHQFSPRTTASQQKSNSSKLASTGHSFVPNLPATYVALYPYKPRKPDELELKKGSVYYVTERCQDGWFKGANRAQKSGVFPGNYVAPLRHKNDHVQLINATKRLSPQNNSLIPQNANSAIPPPELPPRSVAPSSSVWTKPLGQHVESFFSKKTFGGAQSKSKDSNCKGESQLSSNQSASKDKKDIVSSTSSAVSLMKRLTNIKRSKSPTVNSSGAYSIDNPVFEDHSVVAIKSSSVSSASPSPLLSSSSNVPSTAAKRNVQFSHPVHVRSGSCPSQLLQSLPVDLNTSAAQLQGGEPSNAYMFGSQRIKGHKERPFLHSLRHNGEQHLRCLKNFNPETNNSGGGSGGPSLLPVATAKTANTVNTQSCSYHRKSQSLDAATISSQIGPGNVALKSNSKTTKERFQCIVSYPPNSEFELELHVGDIVFVHKKRDNGWYKGTHSRTGKTGLFPASFVEPDI